MKNKIYREDFENFLKENANDFVMVPSRKVWYSLYNNMHPDRKWPSVAVCLLILSGVLYIGISENYNLSNAARRSAEQNLSGLATNYTNSKLSRFFIPPPTASKDATAHLFTLHPSPVAGIDPAANPGTENDFNNKFTSLPDELSALAQAETGTRSIPEYSAESPVFSSLNDSDPVSIDGNNKKVRVSGADAKNVNPIIVPETVSANNTALISETAAVKNTLTAAAEFASISANDKPWREDYAFRNKPAINKFKQNAGFSYYITPSFGYRGFFLTEKKTASSGTAALNDGAALNLEAGAAVLYNISRNIRLKGGLQANYTNYVSKVTELNHPTQATLAVDDVSMASRSSVYAVKAGFSRLNKTTLQVAMPLGADIRLAGRNKIKWYVGGTIQPTFVISGSAYVLSADGNHYISETPLLRKWNMNAAIETFVSFKPGAGITLNVGPQFRHQLLSTYKKEYNYTEKLYNIGVKIGITTGL
ncbi:MAG: hypothetical protein WKF88_00140 [Ferruginibacter sp.]